MADKDPLTLLTNCVVATLQESPAVKLAMGLAKKNIHAFNKSRSGTQTDVRAEADLPELAIEPSGGPTNINLASNLCSMDWGMTLGINSGDQRVTEVLNPVLFAVWATLAAKLIDGPVMSLQWQNQVFVHHYSVQNVTIGKSNPDMNRGIKGWTSICSLLFNLHFDTNTIKTFVAGE